jgi:hypothetical protein
MKKLLALGFASAALLVIFTTGAEGSQTLSLVSEYRDGNQKVCVYSDGRNSEEVRKSLAGACPSKHIKR